MAASDANEPPAVLNPLPMASTELPPAGADDVLYLIDLSGYIFRAYHAIPELSSPTGEPTNATYGTVNMLSKMFDSRAPAYVAVAMDSRGKGFRGEIDPNYKANRPPAPPDLPPQMARCREIVEAWSIPVFARDGFEADDEIATITRQAVDAGLRVVIASSDKDLMQLVVQDKVWMWDAMRNRVFGPDDVLTKFGVGPEKVRDLLALVGDSSDNVAGVPGVGVKTAAKLLDQFGSIDGLYEGVEQVKRPKLKQSLIDHQDAARLAQKLVALREDENITLNTEALRFGGADLKRLRELFKELHFTRLLAQLDDFEGQETVTAVPSAQQASEEATHPQGQARNGAAPLITSIEALTALIKSAREHGQLAVTAIGPEAEPMRCTLSGLALAVIPEQSFYLPIGHRYLGVPKQLSLEEIRPLLGPLLADPSLPKIGHDLKFTQVVLARHGLAVRGGKFDSMLASYLIDPETSHRLPLLAERDASMSWTTFETIAPKPKKGPKPIIEDVELDTAAPYAAAHAEAALRLQTRYRTELDVLSLDALNDELELPLSKVLVEMELLGVQLNPKPLQQLSTQMASELVELEKKAHAAAKQEFNVASPKQLEHILFDELELKSSRKTKTGRSTDAAALEAIVDDHPLPKLVLEYRAIAKLKNTYVDTLPKLIHPETGRIHTRWEQAVTATGRLSSKDPNLQNIPVRSQHGKQIREAFTAPEGMVILSADYSQIELRVLAHLSKDPVLMDAFNNAQDVHVRTAMEVFGVSAEDVSSEMRAQSKTVNFGVIYGMGPVALSKRLGISRKEAKQFIDAYFDRYQGVKAFMDETLIHAKENRTVVTLLGRRRCLADLESRNHAKRAYAERIAQNTPIQGTAADLLKLAMVKLADPVAPGVRMVMTVHDELVFEVPAEHIEAVANKVKTTMESVYPLDVPLVVDVGHGPTWAHAH